jgi:carbonic anhydrase
MSEQATAEDLTDESGSDHESVSADGASRRGFLRAIAIAGGGLVLGAGVGRSMAQPAGASPRPKTAREIADALIEGNGRFAAGASQHPHLGADVRAAQATKQTPFAAVLACADSRVSPELLFDQGIGDLFVVRVAGNTGSAEAVASLAYAVEHLGVGFIMVLGHESCGAVKATVDSVASGKSAGELEPLVAPIRPAVRSVDRSRDAGEVLSDAVAANAKMVAAGLPKASAILHEAIERRKLTIQAATYDVRTSTVTALTPVV